MNSRIKQVADIAAGLEFISDSQSVRQILDDIGIEQTVDIDSLFVLYDADDQPIEVWAMSGVVPYLTRFVERIR